MSIVAAVIIFGLMVAFHEFGHYLAAKLAGVYVQEFAVGFGPKLLGFKGTETAYSLRAFPLGGFCRMAGMEPDEEESYEAGRGFNEQGVLARMAIIASGPLMNFVLAVIAFAVLFGVVGVTELNRNSTTIGQVIEGYPAAEAGLREGDRILSVDGQKVDGWDEMVEIIQLNAGKEISLTYERGGQIREVRLTPQSNEERDGQGFIGIQGEVRVVKVGPLQAVRQGFLQTGHMVVLWFRSIGMVIAREVAPDFVGPVGITQLISQAVSMGFGTVLNIAGVLNVIIAIMNLLPIPALDGSRLVFLALEGVRGKPIDPRKENLVHLVGFVFLILLSIVITYQDVMRLTM